MSLPVMTIEGDVGAVHSHWTGDGSRIVTEATIRPPEGADVVVRQAGGSVDGIAMISMPGPVILELGMTVALAAHRDVDLAQHEHVVVDSVKVLAYPPDYVRALTKNGRPFYWESGCAFVTVDAAGTTALPDDQVVSIVDASMATWNNDTATCSYLKLKGDGRKALEVACKDYINLIKFRDTVWAAPAIGDDPPVIHDPGAAGLTTVTYVREGPQEGAIVDADIEINGVNFAISANGETMSDPTRCKAELQNTLTHELGHLLGFAHTCQGPGQPQGVDNHGDPVPSCGLVFPGNPIADTTMYPFQDCGEIKKATLEADDIQAVCDVYPVSNDPRTCDRVSFSGGCCSASGDRPEASLFLAGSVLLWLRRRKASRDACAKGGY
jgi:pregnancy-associated plasma protein-A